MNLPFSYSEFLYNLIVGFCFLLTATSGYYFVLYTKKSDQDLRETKARLNEVFENSSSAIFYIDLQEKLQLFNERAAKDVLSVIGKKLKKNSLIYEFLPVNLHNEFKTNLIKAYNGQTISYEREIVSNTGEIHYFENILSPVYAENKIIGVTTKGSDITEKKRAYLELEQRTILHQTFFDASPDALFLINKNELTIISLNKLARSKFQIKEYNLIHFYDLFDQSLNNGYWSKVTKYLDSHEVWSQEIICQPLQGNPFLGEVYIKQFDLLNTPHFIVRISDLAKKEVERENQREFLKLKKQVIIEKDRQENLKLIIQGQESERLRISQELHDGLGQMLTATRLHIGTMTYMNENRFEQDINQVKRLIDELISEIKLISNNLMPTGLDDFGLISALENAFSLFPNHVSIIFDYAYNVKNIELTELQNISLFRIIQEAVNNAIKYAKTDKIFVCMGIENSELFVEIYDHGKGFDLAELKKSKKLSHGLTNMQERASIINAALDIESEVGKGTKINIALKLN